MPVAFLHRHVQGTFPLSKIDRRTPMNEDFVFDDDVSRPRRNQTPRSRPPRAARTAIKKRTAKSPVGGTHQRRNKHWNW